MKLIRVLHVVGAMNRGGAEVLLMELYKNIDRNKVQFDFMVHTQDDSLFDKEILSLGGKIFKLENRFIKKPFSYLCELYLFFKNHSEYDCIHSHLNGMSGYILWMAKKASIEIRISHSHIAAPKNDILRHIVKWFGKKLIGKNSNLMLGCSSDAIFYLSGLAPDNQKRILMKNAIDIKNFKFNEEKRSLLRKSLGISHDAFVIGNVARFEDQKNHLFLIDVFKDILKVKANSVLVLIGTGSLFPKIQKKVQELNIEANVKFLGVRNDVPSLLNAIDVFFMPSLYEGLGIVLIEAQANGLPCVASDTIPKEADINAGLMNFLSLDSDKNLWRDTILNVNRNNYTKEPQLAAKDVGYDIKQVSEWLQNFYINRLQTIL